MGQRARAKCSISTVDSTPEHIDLILMDVLMPGAGRRRDLPPDQSRAHLQDIPVIMVTAKSDLSNLQDAFAAGAMDFITKPVNSMELLARVSSRFAAEAGNGLPEKSRTGTAPQQ